VAVLDYVPDVQFNSTASSVKLDVAISLGYVVNCVAGSLESGLAGTTGYDVGRSMDSGVECANGQQRREQRGWQQEVLRWVRHGACVPSVRASYHAWYTVRQAMNLFSHWDLINHQELP